MQSEDSNRLLKKYLVNADVLILTLDSEGRVTFANSKVCDILGIPQSNLIQKDWFDSSLTPDYSEAIKKEFRGMVNGNPGFEHYEAPLRTPKGDEHVIEWHNVALKDGEGKVAGILSTGIDITAQKGLQEELRKSEERFRDLFENANDLIQSVSPEGHFIFVNRAWLNALGYSQEEVERLNVFDVIHPDCKGHCLEMFKRVMAGEDVDQLETIFVAKDGRAIVVEGSVNCKVEGGRPIYSRGIFRNITERKRMEEALRASEANLRKAQQIAHLGSWSFDVQTKKPSWSGEMFSIYGIDGREEPAFPEGFMAIVHPNDWQMFYDAVEGAIQTGRGYEMEIRLKRKDGSLRYIVTKGEVERDSGGRIVRLSGTSQDITERKNAEIALRKSEEDYRELVENANSIIFKWDADGTILSFNEFAEKFFGFTRDEAIGKNLYDTILPRSSSQKTDLEKLIAEIFAHEDKYSVHINQNVKKDGQAVWISWTNRAIEDKDGRLVAVLSVGTDITEKKKMEEQLERYSKHLEEIILEKTNQLREAERFSAIGQTAMSVAHDLKSPLQVMAYSVYIAREYFKSLPISELQGQEIEAILTKFTKQIDYMSGVITELQDFARPAVPDTRNANLLDFLNECTSNVKLPESVKLVLEVPKTTQVTFDPLLMQRAFVNLFTNAVQAMPNGGQLTVRAEQGPGKLMISVADTGLGISEENLKKIFLPFFTTKQKGLGLGLVIIKRIVEAHNGTVSVESAVGKGTKFTLGLPVPLTVATVKKRESKKN